MQGEQKMMIDERQFMAQYPGVKGPVGTEQVRKAYLDYKKYHSGLQPFIDRVVNAEEWWKNNHWERFEKKRDASMEVKPTSAWLFNSIINKHADYMDNYPCPAILSREKSDEKTAEQLSDVVPVILEQNGFAKSYNECSWDKTKVGTAVYAVLWNQSKENGLGDVEISQVDILNITWEPGIDDIQDSRNIFITKVQDVDLLESTYPFLKGEIKGGNVEKLEYIYRDKMDTANKIVVYDWYYKKHISQKNGTMKAVMHYCKFVEDHVIYASENDPKYAARGFYDHGKYPFVFDTMFPEKGSPAGFGYLDVMVNPQEYIDRLDQVILKNALMNKPRYFVSTGAGINPAEFTDLSKDLVQCTGRVDDETIKQIQPPQISDIVFNQRDAKVNELKETSGNRDFSQGSTTSGVTAASAIAALQEAGSKLSRDMIKGTYTAFEEVVSLTIELIRQFYDLPRCYRITKPNGTAEYVEFTNKGLVQQETPMMTGKELSVRRPAFDIKVSAQKASPYSRIAQNELAKELYGMGLFNPQLADQALAVVKMMDFDHRNEVIQTIQQNGLMYNRMQQMGNTMQQMAALIAKTTGDTSILQALQSQGMAQMGMTDINAESSGIKTDALGRPVNADGGTAGKARERVSNATEVRA